MVKITKKAVFIIVGVTALTGGVAAGTAIALTKLIKKHAELGMTKAEVLKKLGDPDHTSESGDYWYYFERKVGKKYKEKDELEHTWNEANQIKAQSIGLELETKHFESKIVQFNSDNVVVSYFYNRDTKYTYDDEKFSSWTEKTTKELKTDIPSGMNCYVYSEDKDGNYHYSIVDDNFKNSFNYEVKFEDKSLLKSSNNTSYDVTGQKNNIHFDWKYDNIDLSTKVNLNPYDARIVAQSESKGVTITGDGFYNIGDKVELKAELKPGYLCKGWDTDVSYFLGERASTHLTDGSTYSFDIENHGKKEYEFLADLEVYRITYNLNGGTNSPDNPVTFTIEDEITLVDPIYLNHDFLGWFDDNGNRVTSFSTGTIGALTLSARWTAARYNLSVISEDTSKGTVAITSGSGYSDESITVVATPVGDCVFKGWYHESTKVSDNATYTFVMPTNDYSLVAHFFTKAEKEEELRRLGGIPTLSDDGKTIIYGLYPQTNVNNSATVSALNALTTPESNGWYLYEGDYYAKVRATPYSTSYKFDNGTTISSGTTYWFKCEPIVWNVLNNNNDEYYIVSSVLLDAQCYCNSTSTRTIDGQTVYTNNYKYSDIRTWLNEDFYNSAFALGNSHIQTTTVNNSASTTNSSNNSYACANTEDKVFLPSYHDYINSSYGFSTSTGSTDTRCCKTTDWARARGAWYYPSSGSYQYNGYYWTRSPRSSYSMYAWCVYCDGGLYGDYYTPLYYTRDSVRPGLSIKIA